MAIPWDYVVFATLAALGGGAFGAAIGALPAFIFTGFLTIAGATLQIVGAQLGMAGVTDQLAPSIYVAAFGPLFGPHVAFAGGAAAHAYAAKYQPDLQETEWWGYHPAKNILVSLGSNPRVLAVGAAFGAGAQLLKMGTDFVTGQSAAFGFAHIAWIVVLSAFVHRLVFGYPLMGDRGKVFGRLGVGTTDEGTATDGGTVTGSTSLLSFDYDQAEPHLPHQFYWTWVVALGATVGLVSGYVTIVTENPWLTFGIAAASLIFLEFDAGFRPDEPLAGTVVTHHIALPSAVAGLAAFNAGGLAYGMLWALVFGVLGAFFRELTERLFYAWGDTHLDPPAFSITITVLLIVILSNLGVIGPNAYQAITIHAY